MEITYIIPKGTPTPRKYFRLITCMSNSYKLTMKCPTTVIQNLVESKGILSENQVGQCEKYRGKRKSTNKRINQ